MAGPSCVRQVQQKEIKVRVGTGVRLVHKRPVGRIAHQERDSNTTRPFHRRGENWTLASANRTAALALGYARRMSFAAPDLITKFWNAGSILAARSKYSHIRDLTLLAHL